MFFEILIIVLLIALGVFHLLSMRSVWSDVTDIIDILDTLNDQQETAAKKLDETIAQQNAQKAACTALRKLVLEQAATIRQLKAELAEHKENEPNEGETESKVNLLEQLWQTGLSNILNYDLGTARKAANADEGE